MMWGRGGCELIVDSSPGSVGRATCLTAVGKAASQTEPFAPEIFKLQPCFRWSTKTLLRVQWQYENLSSSACMRKTTNQSPHMCSCGLADSTATSANTGAGLGSAL